MINEVNIQDAIDFTSEHRNVPPGLYNQRRLLAKKVTPSGGGQVLRVFQNLSSAGNFKKPIDQKNRFLVK